MVCIHDPRRPPWRQHGSGSLRVTAARIALAAVSIAGFAWLIAYGDAVPLVFAIASSWSTGVLVWALGR